MILAYTDPQRPLDPINSDVFSPEKARRAWAGDTDDIHCLVASLVSKGCHEGLLQTLSYTAAETPIVQMDLGSSSMKTMLSLT
jgi:hypothetical protein